MATKLYLTSKSPSTALAGPLLGAWSGGDSHRDARGAVRYVFLLDPDPALGGTVGTTGTPFGAKTSKTANQKLICAGQVIWVTKRLAGSGTLTGSVSFVMSIANAGAPFGGPAFLHVHAYITQGDTLTLRSTIINNVTDTTPLDSTGTYVQVTQAVSGSYVAGDRIVFEIGVSASPPTSPAGDTLLVAFWGTTGGFPSYTVLADAVAGNPGYTPKASWLSFSSTLTWATPTPPANDACADATAITTLPYSSGAVDTTGSLDTDKAVWFTWTAPSTTRVFLTTRGTNYRAQILVYKGCGGSTQALSGAPTKLMWSGRGQAYGYFTPALGQTYAIKVLAADAGLYGAPQSNGSLSLQLFQYSLPAIDDVYVDCQYIVAFRGQSPVNWLGDFYSYTPTAPAIDYTLRPMTNLGDGSTHTAERYYFCLFGTGGWLEVLDLATLNVGEGEIDTIQDIWNGNDNPGSLVFDHTGNILVGWYGNHYDVNGGLATGGSANIRKADARHADNQPGHPFAQALSFAAALDAGGTDFVDLSHDQDTIFYTSSGTKIKRWSIASGQLADFATVPASLSARPGAHGLRLLPPSGTGADGLLVTVGDRVYRLNAAGAVIQTYIPTPAALAQDLDKIEITHDVLHFWVSDQLSTNLFKFNIASGAQVDRLDTGLPIGQLSGFTIYKGYRGGDPPPGTPGGPPDGGGGPGPGEPGGPGTTPPDVAPSYHLDARYIRRLRRAPHINQENARVFIRKFELDLERGQGLASGQGADPMVLLRLSRDGGQTWGEELRMSAGALGAYTQRALARRLGQGRDTVFEVVVSDPIAWSLVGAWLDLEPGTS